MHKCVQWNGFSNVVTVIDRAFYGQGSGQIWLDDLNCAGIEWTIGSCSHGGWGNHNYSHNKNASADCTIGTYVCRS